MASLTKIIHPTS